MQACLVFKRRRKHCVPEQRSLSTCLMAQVRRKFVDIYRAQGSAIADEAIKRIAQLYVVEKEARGSPPDLRVTLLQAKAKLVLMISKRGCTLNCAISLENQRWLAQSAMP